MATFTLNLTLFSPGKLSPPYKNWFQVIKSYHVCAILNLMCSVSDENCPKSLIKCISVKHQADCDVNQERSGTEN